MVHYVKRNSAGGDAVTDPLEWPVGTQRFHFSVDDVIAPLIEVSDRRAPLFSHPFFADLRELHCSFGTPVDLYLFFEQQVDGGRRTLRDVSAHVREEFQQASWLRLGPHGLDSDHPPYVQTPEEQRTVFDAIFREIDRFAGPGKRSQWVRLHCFSEAYEAADYWRENGVSTLLLTDEPAIAYHLPEAERTQLARHGVIEHRGLTLRRTHERAEALAAQRLTAADVRERLDRHLKRHGFLVVFTHDSDLRREPVRAMCRACLEHARERGLTSSCPTIRSR